VTIDQRIETTSTVLDNALDSVAHEAMRRVWLRTSMLVDDEFRIRWVSENIESFLGWTREEVVGMYAIDLLHPDDAVVCLDILQFELEVDPATRWVSQRRNVRDTRIQSASGDFRVLEVALTNFRDQPDIGMLLVEISAPTQFHAVDHAIELSRLGANITNVLEVVLSQFTSADPWQPAAAVLDLDGEGLAATANAPYPFGDADAGTFTTMWELPLQEGESNEPVGTIRFWDSLHRPHPLDIESAHRVARHAALAIRLHNATAPR
jgi:PAS domain S-box-containing protein